MRIAEDRLELMCALYREWNERINVISRKDIDNIREHHIAHSLAIADWLETCRPEDFRRWSEGGVKVLDLGTGGGFPGIPLACAFPRTEFVLCDSIGKKVKVAAAVAEGLGLQNVRCVNARAESLDESFDWVVSRAVAPLPDLCKWVRGKYSEGLICLKGGDLALEIAALPPSLRPTVSAWPIPSSDPWFEEKFVIFVK